MTITYRVPREDEFEPFIRPVWRGFGEPGPPEEQKADERLMWEPARSIGALDGDEWVGGGGILTMDLTLPGGAVIPAAGVTMVGVAATHRRRGILTELMRRQLDDVAAAGEPVAMLTASESLIYGRFGYGLATQGVRLRIDPAHSRLRPEASVLVGASSAGGRLRQVTVDEARALLPPAYERVRTGRPGSVARTPGWWEAQVFLDRERHRDGGGSLAVLVHEDATGAVDGWALYRSHHRWDDRLPGSTLRVEDIAGAGDAVVLALWRGLLDHDLVTEVDVFHGALDDPLRWALLDPRRLRASEITDWLWVRLLDVPAALSPRRWGAAGRVVLEVADPFRPTSGGRFLVEADADGAGAVTATGAEADVALGTEELAAISLGGVAPSTLARIGRVVERRPGALAVADALFSWPVTPHCLTMF